MARFPAVLAATTLTMTMALAGCQGGSPDKPKEAPPAAKAQAPAPAEAAKPAEPPKPPEPVWPDPLPAGWKVVADYEDAAEPPKGELRKNRLGGVSGNWGYKAGKCRLDVAPDGGSGRLKITWALPMGDSQCGTFELFAGAPGKAKPFDLTPYDRVAFLVKSGDDAEHNVRFEIVELDPYDAAQQGYTGESKPIKVGRDWQRVEVRFDDVLHPMFQRKSGKQIGLRVDRKSEENASGVVLMDNVTLVEKGS